jgi:hypothetical protein
VSTRIDTKNAMKNVLRRNLKITEICTCPSNGRAIYHVGAESVCVSSFDWEIDLPS